jgi:hypothetical protein
MPSSAQAQVDQFTNDVTNEANRALDFDSSVTDLTAQIHTDQQTIDQLFTTISAKLREIQDQLQAIIDE